MKRICCIVLWFLLPKSARPNVHVPNWDCYSFTEADGLSSRNVLGAVTDRKGRHWILSSDGLSLLWGLHVYNSTHWSNFPASSSRYFFVNLFYDSLSDQLTLFLSDNGTSTVIERIALSGQNEVIKPSVRIPGGLAGSVPYGAHFICVIGEQLLEISHDFSRIIRFYPPNIRFSSVLQTQIGIVAISADGSVYQLDTKSRKLKLASSFKIKKKQEEELLIGEGIVTLKDIRIENTELYHLHQLIKTTLQVPACPEISEAKGILKIDANSYLAYGPYGLQQLTAHAPIASAVKTSVELRGIWYSKQKNKGLAASSKGIYEFSANNAKAIRIKLLTPKSGYYYSVVETDSLLLFPALNPMDKSITYSKSDDSAMYLDRCLPGTIYKAEKMPDHTGWLFGTENGIYEGQVIKHNILLQKQKFGELSVRDFCQSGKELIAACANGLYVLKRDGKYQLIDSGEYHCVLQIPGGYVAGSKNTGLTFLDSSFHVNSRLNRQNHFATNTVFSLHFSRQLQVLWVGGLNNLIALHLPTGKSKCFTEQDGLAGDEFNRGSVFGNSDDSIFIMGGTKGLSFIHSNRLMARVSDYYCASILKAEDQQGVVRTYFIPENLNQPLEINSPEQITIPLNYTPQNSVFLIFAYRTDNGPWRYCSGQEIHVPKLGPGNHIIELKVLRPDFAEVDAQKIRLTVSGSSVIIVHKSILLVAIVSIALLVLLLLREKFLRISAKAALTQNREQMFSIIAHDLQSPLKNLKGLTSFVNKSYQEQDWTTLMEICQEVEKAGEDLDLLLTNLLNWSLLNQNIFSSKPALTSVDELIAPIIKNYTHIAQQSGRVLQFDNQCSEHLIFLDVRLLSLVLRNLVDNAIKYSPANSTTLLRCTELDADIYFQVSNAVLPSHVPNILEVLLAIDKPGSETSHLGLGINLIKLACNSMNAAIKAIFDMEQAYLTFTIKIKQALT